MPLKGLGEVHLRQAQIVATARFIAMDRVWATWATLSATVRSPRFKRNKLESNFWR